MHPYQETRPWLIPSHLWVFAFFLPPPAVQEERQKNKERDGDYECSSSANEEMPVEKILEAETAVEHRTDLHSDATGSVSVPICIMSFV